MVMMDIKEKLEINQIEIKLLLEAIYLKFGYDFRNYTKQHIKRRMERRVKLDELDSISQITEKVLYDENYFKEVILQDLSVNTTEMFRHPLFYKTLREKVIPILKSYPSINIWNAGCSSGEEVLSTAILFYEEGLLDKTQIYATDFNEKIIEKAKKRIYPIEKVKKWTKNYQKSGGKKSFAEYYVAKYESIIFDERLLDNVTFLEHNLINDHNFITAHLIICRNVFIYFDKGLQDDVLDLFSDSLVSGGFLGIGSKESIQFSRSKNRFSEITSNVKIFQKNYLGGKL